MQITTFAIPGLLLLSPTRHGDDRGWFAEVWNLDSYRAAGIKEDFVQDNLARSRKNVLRGLHAQEPYAQGKLVQVYTGAVFDVAVDARRESPTFGRWQGMTLSGENGCQFYLPPGLLHGYLVLSDSALLGYKTTQPYAPSAEWGVMWNDPEIGIDWPVTASPILSEKDRHYPPLSNVDRQRLTPFQF